jgi:hypothetical protein
MKIEVGIFRESGGCEAEAPEFPLNRAAASTARFAALGKAGIKLQTLPFDFSEESARPCEGFSDTREQPSSD